ncbi:hypothetical protein Bca52824_064436 [Brassica carinata]|uniref:Uncharacterized protein n=1 Tax=Brassica carinata TaxID=52824 RepID=A0A8X7UA62_BRACI|nr:hypothetical protein Bca52824_064436 [Brassica carinata]
MIMNTKKLIKMVKKWQQRAALHRKRISFQRSNSGGSSSTSLDKVLLKISEEEFGLPTEGPITLPFDSVFLEYLIKLVQRRMDEDTEKALLMSISSARCSWQCSLQLQDQSSCQHLLVF